MTIGTAVTSELRIIVPVRNGGGRWREVAEALRRCVADPATVAVIDSGSTDGSDDIAARLGFVLERIDPASFNHGRTRQDAVDRYARNCTLVVFLTHDAVLESPSSLDELVAAFEDPRMGAAYGRQLPHHGAGPFARHNAAYLYPPEDSTRSMADAARYGLRTTHLSNSFAAYRVGALYDCGGFPSGVILGEDAFVALRLLQKGWNIGYRSKALVRHSHDYSIAQEMRRYFDYGVFHAQLPELPRTLGSAEGEGLRFVTSELRFVAAQAPWQLPLVPLRNGAKYLGYHLGRHFKQLPMTARRGLSMTRGFWDAPTVRSPAP